MAELEGHDVFRTLDLPRVRQNIETIRMHKGTPVPAIVEAIAECAAKTDGAGIRTDALLRNLIGFVNHAKPRQARQPTADHEFQPAMVLK